MSSIGSKSLADLRSIKRSGAFCVGGTREIFMPGRVSLAASRETRLRR
jgi:hypothetical protein